MTLRVNERAPSFKGEGDDGKQISMDDYLGKMNIVLYFYPKDNSPGCTREACKFRDEFDEFGKLNAVIIGVNRGSVESHRKFREKRSLPFSIISDREGSIHKAYDVKAGLISERVTYVIDREGIIREVYNSQMNYMKHPDIAKEALLKIEGSQTG
ncbi:MAG: peroxiredoxin [Candidatus Thermoplasmatota archaeon]|jgi:peroxiredoxin Q/BCP|nr:peroxiredoxin [Candidatus Thermoplasmatota archaeon]